MSKDLKAEMDFIDMPDETLKLLVGELHETIKRGEEEKKNDGRIVRVKEALKRYVDRVHDDELRALKSRLKAARRLAKLRGIKFDQK